MFLVVRRRSSPYLSNLCQKCWERYSFSSLFSQAKAILVRLEEHGQGPGLRSWVASIYLCSRSSREARNDFKLGRSPTRTRKIQGKLAAYSPRCPALQEQSSYPSPKSSPLCRRPSASGLHPAHKAVPALRRSRPSQLRGPSPYPPAWRFPSSL